MTRAASRSLPNGRRTMPAPVLWTRRPCTKRSRPLSRYPTRQNSHRRPSYDAILHSRSAWRSREATSSPFQLPPRALFLCVSGQTRFSLNESERRLSDAATPAEQCSKRAPIANWLSRPVARSSEQIPRSSDLSIPSRTTQCAPPRRVRGRRRGGFFVGPPQETRGGCFVGLL